MNRAGGYPAGGLLLPVTFIRSPEPPGTSRTCLSVARWRDGEGWISQGDMNHTCFDVPHLACKP